MTKPDGERIATLETKMNDLADKLNEVSADVKEIKDILINSYVTKEEFARLERSSNFWKFLSPTLAAVAGSIMTFLIIEYFRSH